MRGSRPASSRLNCDLSPVPFYQHPSIMAMDPVMRHPHRVRARRMLIVSRHPDIAGSVPAVITGDPHKTGCRRRSRMLNNCHRWSDANDNLRI
jgi:hypothetical protein